MQETQATAAALEHVPGPGIGGEITFEGVGLSPAALKLKIQNDKEMRQILTDYVKSEMVEGHHFSTTIGTQKLAKPMLLDEGARNICSLFNLFFGEPRLVEEWLEGDHYRVRAHIGVFNRRGEQVASGDALCSTRESKYAFRKSERVCPKCDQAAIRKDNKKEGGGWYCWSKLDGCGAQFPANEEAITSQQLGRVDNPDLADAENTVLKIAIKRAKTAAVRDLPVVSEIFAPEGGGGSGDGPQSRNTSSPPQGKGNAAARNGGTHSAQPSPAPPTTATSVSKAANLWAKLVEKGAEVEDLVTQFLPEGVATIDGVDEQYAESILEPLSNLLNARLKKSN